MLCHVCKPLDGGMVQLGNQMPLPFGDVHEGDHHFHQHLNCRTLRGVVGGGGEAGADLG